MAASSLYMSPTDCMLEIVLPFLGWFLLLEVEHIVTVIVVVVIGGWMAMYEHSGEDSVWISSLLQSNTCLLAARYKNRHLPGHLIA